MPSRLRPIRLFLRAKAWHVSDQFASMPDYLYRGVLKMRSLNGSDLAGLRDDAIFKPRGVRILARSNPV